MKKEDLYKLFEMFCKFSHIDLSKLTIEKHAALYMGFVCRVEDSYYAATGERIRLT